jgi:hypothetical protein
MAFQNVDFKKIYDFSGKEFLEKEFKESYYTIKLNEEANGVVWDLIISVNKEKFACLFMKKKKKAGEGDDGKEEREALKKELEQVAQDVAVKFSDFRVRWYTSLIDKMLLEVKEKRKPEKFSFHLNDKNILHVLPSQDRVELIFGVNFIYKTDISLAKVFLQELEEAKRHVVNCLDAKVYQEADSIPIYISNIDKPKNYSNGLVVFNLYVKDYNMVSKKLSYFVNFRQYIQFHVHSIKTFLHIRMNKKGRELENKLNSCKIIPDDYLKQLDTLNFYVNWNKKEENARVFMTESKKLNV